MMKPKRRLISPAAAALVALALTPVPAAETKPPAAVLLVKELETWHLPKMLGLFMAHETASVSGVATAIPPDTNWSSWRVRSSLKGTLIGHLGGWAAFWRVFPCGDDGLGLEPSERGVVMRGCHRLPSFNYFSPFGLISCD